jgi:hypothetical protein
MNKKALAILLIFIIGIAGVSGIAVYYLYLGKDTEASPFFPFLLPTSPSPSYVRVYVNSSIYSEIQSEITQYEQDLEEEGYYVDSVIWSNTNISDLKTNLTYYYNNYPNVTMRLYGAVLVGDMPYALADEGGGPYPIDLYLMDLDGVWNNVDPSDGKYDIPSDPTGDNSTEIFLARINPNPLNNMNNLTVFQNYFQRNHAYRNGTLTRPHSALLYIDDTWATSLQIPGWTSTFTAYSNVTLVTDHPTTNRTDYLNRYTQNYEWIHLFAHSDPGKHHFTVLSTTEYVYNTDILNNDTKALFYNLYCCSACDYTYTNNLGTQYLFSNNTLTVLGTTKIGGMSLYQTFYDSLKNGKNIGEAFEYWFNNNPADTISPAKRYQFFGMTILGDLFLTIL